VGDSFTGDLFFVFDSLRTFVADLTGSGAQILVLSFLGLVRKHLRNLELMTLKLFAIYPPWSSRSSRECHLSILYSIF
jgi:hypothetical protein